MPATRGPEVIEVVETEVPRPKSGEVRVKVLAAGVSLPDVLTLLELLKQGQIKPFIAERLPLEEARRAHEMLGHGGVLGKIVLLPNG